MKRNNDKISSKYRIRWFGSVTEVEPGTAIIGNFRRLRPVQSVGSVRFGYPFYPQPVKVWVKCVTRTRVGKPALGFLD